MICLFPQGLVFFQSWRTLRWFLLMLVPVLVSAGASWARLQDGGLVIVVGLVGVAVASILFVELCSGMASSNWGTHFRSKLLGASALHRAVLPYGFLHGLLGVI
jgi:hypothetical protein